MRATSGGFTGTHCHCEEQRQWVFGEEHPGSVAQGRALAVRQINAIKIAEIYPLGLTSVKELRVFGEADVIQLV